MWVVKCLFQTEGGLINSVLSATGILAPNAIAAIQFKVKITANTRKHLPAFFAQPAAVIVAKIIFTDSTITLPERLFTLFISCSRNNRVLQ